MNAHFDAIVLAGGRAQRLGGIDKAEILLDGERLVDRTVTAARGAGARQVVIVGPDSAASPGALTVREDPPFGGPLAAVAAALPLVAADWVMLLSCDLERPTAVCDRLIAAFNEPATEDFDGLLLRDAEGHPQWLAGLHRTDSLRRETARLPGEAAGRPLRELFVGAHLREVIAPNSETADIDLPEDLERIATKEPS